MIQLRDKDNKEILGTISKDDLQFLIDSLEEESEEDTDYYLNRTTLEMLKKKGSHQALLDLLEKALGDRDEMEFEWNES